MNDTPLIRYEIEARGNPAVRLTSKIFCKNDEDAKRIFRDTVKLLHPDFQLFELRYDATPERELIDSFYDFDEYKGDQSKC